MKNSDKKQHVFTLFLDVTVENLTDRSYSQVFLDPSS